MGKNLIIPNSDFSQNSILIPLRVTLGAGKSYVLGGQTITNASDSEKAYEFASVNALARRTSFSETNDAITRIVYISNVNLAGSSFFKNFIGLKHVSFKGVTTPSWGNTFENCSNLEEVFFQGDGSIYSQVNSCYAMFSGCSSLKEIDLSNLDTSGCLNFDDLFKNCISLTKITLGVHSVISENATTSSIFNGCSNLSIFDCRTIDSTTADGIALKSRIENIISNSKQWIKPDANMYWANGIVRHWNGSSWSNA